MHYFKKMSNLKLSNKHVNVFTEAKTDNSNAILWKIHELQTIIVKNFAIDDFLVIKVKENKKK